MIALAIWVNVKHLHLLISYLNQSIEDWTYADENSLVDSSMIAVTKRGKKGKEILEIFLKMIKTKRLIGIEICGIWNLSNWVIFFASYNYSKIIF